MDFDLNNLIERIKDKDFIEILDDLVKERTYLKRLSLSDVKKAGKSEYKFSQYKDHIGDFLFFLNSGMTPATTGLDGLKKFLPVINNLVEKKQLKPEVLDRFSR